jgi:hypothetical protein
MASIPPEMVKELKRKMAAEKEIGDVMRFFFDNFVDNPEFMSLGHHKDIPAKVQEAVYKSLAAALGKTEFLVQWVSAEIPEMQLIHGSVTVNGSMGCILWAPEIETVILGIPKKPLSPEMLYARLSFMPGKVM